MTAHPKTVSQTDISADHFLFKIFPKNMHPYIKLGRFDRPIGAWLLLLPGLWGISLASGGFSGYTFNTLKLMLLFFIGGFAIRAAGCTINDIWDRNIDGHVERTKTRPLPSGELNLRQAFVFLFFLLCLALAVLLQLNTMAIIIGCMTLIPIAIYPLMKRVTFWPQLFLGLTFNISALIGWVSVTGSLSTPAFLIYLSGIFWTIGFDTIYAHQDKRDDVKIGVKSSALALGGHTKLGVGLFYTLSYFCLSTAYFMSVNTPAYISAIPATLPALQLAWQIKDTDLDQPNKCLEAFKSNKFYGLLALICFSI